MKDNATIKAELVLQLAREIFLARIGSLNYPNHAYAYDHLVGRSFEWAEAYVNAQFEYANQQGVRYE